MFDLKVLLFCLTIPTYECFFGKPKEETIEEKLAKGMLGETAELPHYTQRFGFVDYRRHGVFNIEKYLNLEQDHSITLQSWTPESWQYMNREISNMKKSYCEDVLKDPVLEENNIEFDLYADADSIQLGTKEVVFFRYKKMPLVDYVVRCPITIQGDDGYFASITLFERTEKEGSEDFYFILLDLYYEDVQDPTNQVVVVMRTKLGARVPLLERMREFLKNSYQSVKYQLQKAELKD